MSKKILAKNVFSVGIIQIANYAFPLISVPVISRIIGPDKFGVINFSASFVTYFTLLIGFGFDLTATRRVARHPDDKGERNRVFSEVFFTQCLLLIISVILFTPFLLLLPELKNEKEVAIYTFLTVFSALLTQNWLFQAMQELSKVAVISLISKILFTAAVFLLIHKKSDYVWQPLALSLSQIIAGLVSFAWSIRRYSLKLLYVPLRDCFRLLYQERIFFLSMCVLNVYTTTNIVILGLLESSSQVGYYTAGQKLIVIFQSVISIPLRQAVFPFIGKAFGESFDRGIQIAQKLLPIAIIITLIGSCCFYFFSPFFIHFLYGEKFAPAILVCKILSPIPLFICVGTICGIHIMMNLNMDKLFFRIISVGALLSVALNFLLTKKFGYIGSAVTWTVTELVNNALLFLFLKREGINVFNVKFFKLHALKGYVFSSRIGKKSIES